MNADGSWLTEDEQRLWRRWVRVSALLPGALHRDLQEESGLSLPDFEVLVHLTDTPDGRVRVTDLARTMHWERSRVSHHVSRMERRGLVRREECAEDGRGAFVVLSPDGRDAIERAAPSHVRTVRRLVFEPLSEAEQDALGGALEKILAGLEDPRPELSPGT